MESDKAASDHPDVIDTEVSVDVFIFDKLMEVKTTHCAHHCLLCSHLDAYCGSTEVPDARHLCDIGIIDHRHIMDYRAE